MTYHGHILNGQIALDEPAELPEGVKVRVELVGDDVEDLTSILLRHAGKGKDLPPDLAENHDRYVRYTASIKRRNPG